MGPLDMLQSEIFNSNEPSQHALELNIKLQSIQLGVDVTESTGFSQPVWNVGGNGGDSVPCIHHIINEVEQVVSIWYEVKSSQVWISKYGVSLPFS